MKIYGRHCLPVGKSVEFLRILAVGSIPADCLARVISTPNQEQ